MPCGQNKLCPDGCSLRVGEALNTFKVFKPIFDAFRPKFIRIEIRGVWRRVSKGVEDSHRRARRPVGGHP
jgi:hypothetical protein